MVITSVPRLVGAPDACVSAQLMQAAAAAMAVQDAKISDGQLTNGRTKARSSAQMASQQRFGSVWTKSFHDASPVISLNAAVAPAWSAALDIDRQVAAGNPFPAATHAPFKASDADQQSAQQDDRRLYQPPVELVVLHSQLQRLGPSTPFRYTAVSAPVVSPEHLQQPLLSPVRSPTGTSSRWAADAGTQTLPAWLAADAERIREGQLAKRPASASPSRQQHTRSVSARPGTAGRLHGSKHSTTSSPWRLVDKHAAANDGKPWVPAGLSDGGVKQQVAASTAAAWAAKEAAGTGNRATQDVVGRCPAFNGKADITRDSCGDWRACSPTSRRLAAQRAKERARQQFQASAKYAAIGRAAARENAAAAAAAAAFTASTENQPQRQQSASPAGQIASSSFDTLTARQTAEQLQQQTTASSVLVSRRFKTVPPYTQPWRPAGAAHGAYQRPSAVLESHASPIAEPVPSSLRAMINRSKQRLDSRLRQPGGLAVLGVSDSEGLIVDDTDWLRSGSSSSQSADTIPKAVMRERLESPAMMDGLRDLAVLDALTAHSDLAKLQALLEETSSQKDTRSNYSWQSPAGHHVESVPALTADERNALPVGSTVGTSLVAAASPVQQHEEELSAALALDSPRPLTADHLRRLTWPQAESTVEGHVVPQYPKRQPGSPDGRFRHMELHDPIRRPGSPGVRYDHIALQSPMRRAATSGQAPLATCVLTAGQAGVKVEDDLSCLLYDSALACNAETNFPPASVGIVGVAAASVGTQAIHVPAAAATCENSEGHNSMTLSARVLAALGPDLAVRVRVRPEPADSVQLAAAPSAQPLWQLFDDHLPNTGRGADQAADSGMELNEGQPAAVTLAASATSTLDGSARERSGSMLARFALNPSCGSSDGDGDTPPSAPVANPLQDVEQLQALDKDSALAATAAAFTAANPDPLVLHEQDSFAEPLAAISKHEASMHGNVRPCAAGYLKASSDVSCYDNSVEQVNRQHCAEGQEDISALESVLQMELNDLDLEFASLEERLIMVATTAQHVPAELPPSHRQSSTSASSGAASQPLFQIDHSSGPGTGDMQQFARSVSMLPLRYHCHEGRNVNDVRSHSVRCSSMADSDMDDSLAGSDVSDNDSTGASQ